MHGGHEGLLLLVAIGVAISSQRIVLLPDLAEYRLNWALVKLPTYLLNIIRAAVTYSLFLGFLIEGHS